VGHRQEDGCDTRAEDGITKTGWMEMDGGREERRKLIVMAREMVAVGDWKGPLPAELYGYADWREARPDRHGQTNSPG
jgi:hypothetical protein